MFIRYGHEKLYFAVPESWNVLTMAEFEDHPEQSSIEELTADALHNPINAAPLEKQLRPSDKIAILIEDNTRNSPKKHLLRILLDHLDNLSIPPENINIIIALGTHKQLSQEEMSHTYGEDIVQRYSFYNHDCMDKDLVPAGALKSGTAVKINRRAYEADFRLGIGSIFPTPLTVLVEGGRYCFRE